MWESRKQKLLGVEMDISLNFDLYVPSPYKKTGKKLSVLAQLSNFMSYKSKSSINENVHRTTLWLFPFVMNVS